VVEIADVVEETIELESRVHHESLSRLSVAEESELEAIGLPQGYSIRPATQFYDFFAR